MVLFQQEVILDHHEDQVHTIEGSHPPHVGDKVGGENIPDSHPERVFNVKENDSEATKHEHD